jgi:hypothetical protein
MADPHPVPDPATLSPSLVRVLIPFIAGLVGTWLLDKGVDLDGSTVGAIVSAVIGYLYYVVARFLEVYAGDKWGYILGIRRKPVYPPGTTPAKPLGDRGAANLALLGFAAMIAGVIGLIVALVNDSHQLVVVFAIVLAVGFLCWLIDGRRTP